MFSATLIYIMFKYVVMSEQDGVLTTDSTLNYISRYFNFEVNLN